MGTRKNGLTPGLSGVRKVLGLLAALAGTACGVFAAPAKPLIVLFTPGVSTGARDSGGSATGDENVSRARQAAAAVRDRFNESGYVDAVLYAPDSPLFARAMMEAKIKLIKPDQPTETECYALAKAAGAGYSAFVVSGLPASPAQGAVDVSLQTEQIEGHKVWRDRRNASGTSGLPGGPSNALLSAANMLVEGFLNGPLRELSRVTPPSQPATQPIPTVRATPPPAVPLLANGEPDVAAPVPMTAPVVPVAPVTAREPLPSSGADTDNAAEAERHQGDDELRAGDIPGAILSYRKAVSLSPLNTAFRASLASAYLQAGRKGDALSEAKRALSVVPATDIKGHAAASRLLADVLTQTGDTVAAKNTYSAILATQPDAVWAQLGLAEALVAEGDTDAAATLYLAARKNAPANHDAMLGYARLLATKGDYDGALRELTAMTGSADAGARYRAALQLFDAGITRIADRVTQNRAAYEKKQIARDVFYKATSAQTAKVSGLVSLLKAVNPPATADEPTKRKHHKRVFAASLLLQGVASLLTQVETGDANAGGEATSLLDEFAREMREVVTATPNTQE